MLPITAQQSGAEGVESAHRKAVHLGADEAMEPFDHLLCCLVCERYGEHPVGADAADPHQVSHPVSDDTGLTAARPGHDQQRAIYGLDGLPLGRIESFENGVCRCGHGYVLLEQPVFKRLVPWFIL